VRDLTLKSTAPKLVYEEGSLIKRAIRDLYTKDIEEIVVAGDDGYREAKDFMRMLMPSHAKNVKPYKDTQPLFGRFGIEAQLDAMFSPVVQLRSGGYIVLNQAEALVAIDVNSGRATREHHIEDTALKTNLEAAEEVARQLRLRDLAGLIVIDFIDMDEKRNNRTVERRLKECLRHDRARIQVGRISHFGLLEMSRQRIRTGVLESSTEKCPVCGGMGHVRSVSSVSLQLLRSLEETLIKGATHNLIVRTRSEVALYVLNHKRAHLRALEERFQVTITITADPTVAGPQAFVVDRGEQVHTPEQARAIVVQPTTVLPIVETEEEEEEHEEEESAEAETAEAEAAEGTRADQDEGPRRRRRRRRGRREGPRPAEGAREPVAEHTVAHLADDEQEFAEEEAAEGEGRTAESAAGANGDSERRRRRRGRRGGRRNRREREPAPLPEAGEPRAEETGAEPLGERWEIGAPQEEPRAAAPARREPEWEPAPQPPQPHFERPVEPAEAAAPAEERPRRGSTVREPPPVVVSGGVPSAPPQPQVEVSVVSEAAREEEREDASKPRRTGWWAKRLMGGKE
jgi:ribonuclease E